MLGRQAECDETSAQNEPIFPGAEGTNPERADENTAGNPDSEKPTPPRRNDRHPLLHRQPSTCGQRTERRKGVRHFSRTARAQAGSMLNWASPTHRVAKRSQALFSNAPSGKKSSGTFQRSTYSSFHRRPCFFSECSRLALSRRFFEPNVGFVGLRFFGGTSTAAIISWSLSRQSETFWP